jgi:hypothetical protein
MPVSWLQPQIGTAVIPIWYDCRPGKFFVCTTRHTRMVTHKSVDCGCGTKRDRIRHAHRMSPDREIRRRELVAVWFPSASCASGGGAAGKLVRRRGCRWTPWRNAFRCTRFFAMISGGRPVSGHQDLGICGQPPEHRRKHLPHVGEPSEKVFHGRHVRRTDH